MGKNKKNKNITTANKAVQNNKGGISQSLDDVGVSLLTFVYKNANIIVMFVATAVALAAKLMVVDHPTNDVVGFIFKWMDEMTELGQKNFYRVDADYSPLYLFFASLISKIPKGEMLEVSHFVYSSNWMLALKTFYFIFDIVNAIAVYCLIYRITNSKNKATAGFIVMTALPMQFINSAVWGQADCIYTCFLLWSLYFALGEKGRLSFLMFGFALSFKLQALFLAPFLVYLLLRRKIKFSDFLFAPLAVLISFLPAYACGASFVEPFMFFGKQVGGYSSLYKGCANFWCLFSYRNSRVEFINRGAVLMALLFIGVLFAIVWLRMIHNTNENLVCVAAFLVGVTVFFLPHMHERYFYLLDVLAVVYSIAKGKRYLLILLMQISSCIAYQNYIGGKYFINVWGEDSVHLAAFAVIAVLAVLLYDILHAERRTLGEVLEEIKGNR